MVDKGVAIATFAGTLNSGVATAHVVASTPPASAMARTRYFRQTITLLLLWPQSTISHTPYSAQVQVPKSAGGSCGTGLSGLKFAIK